MKDVAKIVKRIYRDHGHADDWGVTVVYEEQLIRRLEPKVATLLAAAEERGAARVRAQVEAVCDRLAAEAEPYIYGGRRYEGASDTLRARGDCRWQDAERVRATLTSPAPCPGTLPPLRCLTETAHDVGHGCRYEASAGDHTKPEGEQE